MDFLIGFLPKSQDLISNIVLFLIGTVSGLTYKKGKQWVFESIENRRMGLSGEFLSFFDDVVEGDSAVHRSTSQVKQRGKRVEILTKAKSGRRWKLSGRIHDRMYLIGDYVAADVHDEGIGTFFLEIKSKDSFVGYWHGYDHANLTVTGGKYWFVRKLDFEVRRAAVSHAPTIVGITSEQFGMGYIESVESIISDETKVVLIARQGKKILGFAYGYLLASGELEGLTGVGRYDPLMSYFDTKGFVGIIKSVAVRAEYQNKSVGLTLLKSVEAELEKIGARAFVVPAWEREGKTPIAGILSVTDYSYMSKGEFFWKDGCDARSFLCPARTQRGCVCNCVFYRKFVYEHPELTDKNVKRISLRRA